MNRFLIMATALAMMSVIFPGASIAQTDTAPVAASISTSATGWERPFQVVLRFTIAEHWHLYWTNPGDAGLAPSITWTLPRGFRATPPRFPTPKKIMADGIVTFGYYHELILITTMIPPTGYRPRDQDTIRADIDWLVCRESCLPGRVTLVLARTGSGSTRSEALEAETRFALTAPKPWRGATDKARYAIASRIGAGLELRFEAPLPASDFFPDLIDDAVTDHSSIRIDRRNISMKVQPSGRGTVIHRLRGILLSGGEGLSIDLPVRYEH